MRPVCFPLPLEGEFVDMVTRTFRLRYTFIYVGRGGLTVVVPAGTETDFASIPRVFHSLLSPCGAYGYAAVVHDYLYRSGHHSRAVADAILLEGMCLSGVPAWQCWAIYLSVRMFGWTAYNNTEIDI